MDAAAAPLKRGGEKGAVPEDGRGVEAGIRELATLQLFNLFG